MSRRVNVSLLKSLANGVVSGYSACQTKRLSSSRPKNTMPTATASRAGRGSKREAGHLVDRPKAEQQAEQREGDDGGEQRVEKRRPEPLAERCAGLSQGAQTFSTSGRPSRPVGKKISTIASIEKAATSLYSMVK